MDRVQGRRVTGPTPGSGEALLPRSDDRPLYWARLTMGLVLRQWVPPFPVTDDQKEEMQWQLERSSRGQYDINLPVGTQYRRMIVSGFDPFSLGAPGSTTSTGIRIGNPSGANALAIDGNRVRQPDGTTLVIESYILPVNYPPFDRGMQEDTLAPWFAPGPRQVHASITVSQGGAFRFDLEQFNGRFHGPSAGNDNIVYCPPPANQRVPMLAECNVYPPERYLGYNPRPWQHQNPAQFTSASMPIASMLAARTGLGVAKAPGNGWAGPEAYGVNWRTNYNIFPDCFNPTTQTVNGGMIILALPTTLQPVAPRPEWCARSGGGGDYLSNESAYRNTLLRDIMGLNIPAGHIHVPVMTRFGNGSGNNQNTSAITDRTFELYRDTIVAQTRNLIFVIGRNLNERPPALPVAPPATPQ